MTFEIFLLGLLVVEEYHSFLDSATDLVVNAILLHKN